VCFFRTFQVVQGLEQSLYLFTSFLTATYEFPRPSGRGTGNTPFPFQPIGTPTHGLASAQRVLLYHELALSNRETIAVNYCNIHPSFYLADINNGFCLVSVNFCGEDFFSINI